jgi:hypothetical protein
MSDLVGRGVCRGTANKDCVVRCTRLVVEKHKIPTVDFLLLLFKGENLIHRPAQHLSQFLDNQPL